MNDEKILKLFESFNEKKLLKYADEIALKYSRYLVYERKGKKVEFFCTHCKKTYTIIPDVKIEHNSGYVCQECKSACTAKSKGMGHTNLADKSYFTTYRKAPYKDGILCVGIVATRDYHKSYDIDTKLEAVALYYFSLDGCHMWKRNWWTLMDALIGTDKKDWEKRATCFDLACDFNTWVGRLLAYEDSTSFYDSIVKTSMKYGLNIMIEAMQENMSFIPYLYRYCKQPKVEYLYKSGFITLAYEYMNNYNSYRAISWRSKTFNKMIKLSKQDIRSLDEHKDTFTTFELKMLQLMKQKNKSIKIKDCLSILKYFNGYIGNKHKRLLKMISVQKLINYLEKQVKKGIYKSKHNVFTDLCDYYEEIEKLEYDLDDDSLLRPKDLKKAHTQTSELIIVKASEKEDKKIQKRYEKLYEKYNYRNNKYIIVPAGSSSELIQESNVLKHCVKNYIKSYASGESDLLFVRKIDEPEQPFYTLEFRNNKLTQCQTYKNKDYKDSKVKGLVNFINDFKDYIENPNQDMKGQKVA